MAAKLHHRTRLLMTLAALFFSMGAGWATTYLVGTNNDATTTPPPYSFRTALGAASGSSGNGVNFSPAVKGLTTTILMLNGPIALGNFSFTIDATGMTPFNVDGGFGYLGIQHAGAAAPTITFINGGTLNFQNFGGFQNASAHDAISFTFDPSWSGTFNFVSGARGSYGFYNGVGTSNGSMDVNIGGSGNINVSGGGIGFYNAFGGSMNNTFSSTNALVISSVGTYGFYNAPTATAPMTNVLSNGVFTVSPGAIGFYNASVMPTLTAAGMSNTLSALMVVSGNATNPAIGFQNISTGIMNNQLSGTLVIGSHATGFYNTSAGVGSVAGMTNTFTGGSMSVNGTNSVGFNNLSGSTMANTFSGAAGLTISGGGYGFQNASAGAGVGMTNIFSGGATVINGTNSTGFFNIAGGVMANTFSGSADLTISGGGVGFQNAGTNTMATTFSGGLTPWAGTTIVTGVNTYGFLNSSSNGTTTTILSGTGAIQVLGGGYGFANTSDGIMSTSFNSGSMTVSNATSYGFANLGTSGTMSTTLGGALTISGGYGFYNNGTSSVMNTYLSSGGAMNVSGGTSTGFFNNTTSSMNTYLQGGTMTISAGGYGFYNVGGTMTTNVTGGSLTISGGSYGFQNVGGLANSMPTTVSGGTLSIDNSFYVGNADTLTLSGIGTFSSGFNGASFAGVDLTFSSGTPTHIAAVGITTAVTLTPPTGLAIGSPSQSVTIGTGFVDLGSETTTLNVVTNQTLRQLQAGQNYPIWTTTNGGTISGKYGPKQFSGRVPKTFPYTVIYTGDTGVEVSFATATPPLTTGIPISYGNAYTMASYMEAGASAATGDYAAVIEVFDILDIHGEYAVALDGFTQIQNSQTNATGVSNTNNQLGVMSASRTQMFSFVSNEGAENNSAGTSSFTKGMQSIDPTRLAAFGKLVMDQRMKTGGVASLLESTSSTPKRKGIIDKASFTNSPEQVNRHVQAGRIQVGKANVWAQPYGQLTSQNGDNNGNPSIHTKTGGIVLGADYEVTPNTLVGVLGGTSATPFSWGENRGNGRMNSGFGGLYTAWKEGSGFYVEGQTIFGGNSFSTNRNINFSTINRTASASYGAFQFTGNLELGYVLPVYEWFTCQPFMVADYMLMRQSSYTETGAQSLNMAVNAKTSQFFLGEVGAMVYKTFTWGETLLRPTAELGWMIRTPMGGTTHVNGGLVSQPSTLVVTGVNKVYNQIAPGLGLIAQFKNGLNISTNVYAECGGGLNIGEALVRVGYEF